MDEKTFLDRFLESGLVGILIVLVTPSLLVWGVLLVVKRRSRERLLVFLNLSFLPMFFCLVDLFLNVRRISWACKYGDVFTIGSIIRGLDAVVWPAMIGFAATGVLLTIASFGLIRETIHIRKERAKSEPTV
ncbi:MAG: hypothetical protein HZA91_19190 [Verrucomicrobia bacterium]|nr:hypothetical protein [Verrucomicrobiota bacterium]